MPSFLNTLGSISRRGQWRFRQVLRARSADGRLDITDSGLVDFSACSEVLLTVVPRPPRHGHPWCRGDVGACHGEAAPVLSASLAAGTLLVSNPGIVESLFPAKSLLAFPAGLYDVRIAVTVGPETAEIFNEPVEFA